MSDQLCLFLTFFFTFAIFFCSQKWVRYQALCRFSKSQACQNPPYHLPYDFMGIVGVYRSFRHLLNKTALGNMSNLFEKYGETYASRIWLQTAIFTCDSRNIKHLLITRFIDFDSSTPRIHFFRPIVGRGIFAVDGPEWKIARDVYRGQFAHTRSIINLSKHEKHFQALIRRIPQAGTSFDLQPLFLSLIFDLTTEFALGESSDSLNPNQSKDKKRFVDALLYTKKIMVRDGFLGPVHHFLSKSDFYKNCKQVHQYVEKLINKKLETDHQYGETHDKEQGPKGYSILRGLTENTKNRLELRDGVITILIAGINSVTSLLSTIF